jgi:hypothetical protein
MMKKLLKINFFNRTSDGSQNGRPNRLARRDKLSAPGLKPGANVIKLFTAVIYRHSMVTPSICVIKEHYLGNYCRMAMAVNYHGICVTNVIKPN